MPFSVEEGDQAKDNFVEVSENRTATVARTLHYQTGLLRL